VIAILDYGMGNLRSVEKAFEHVSAEEPEPRTKPTPVPCSLFPVT
jgi:imidazoleglycerol phosphate synthase glutamine amidotransferase subunit HisH